jgi:uncharacterized membrane-anchored protein
MSPARKTLLTTLAVAAVALAQTAVLAYMVVDRIQLLRTGREIVLPVLPYDPRDLFRGEYVVLTYAIARVATVSAGDVPVKPNQTLYVTLEKSGEGDWRAVEASRTLKREDGPDRIVLKARALWGWPGPLSMRYGIESYFVRQGEGRKLEALTRERKLSVLVAVGKDGTAAIKGLIIDGKLQYEEPLL